MDFSHAFCSGRSQRVRGTNNPGHEVKRIVRVVECGTGRYQQHGCSLNLSAGLCKAYCVVSKRMPAVRFMHARPLNVHRWWLAWCLTLSDHG